jgi:hypothetical protein
MWVLGNVERNLNAVLIISLLHLGGDYNFNPVVRTLSHILSKVVLPCGLRIAFARKPSMFKMG